MNYEKLGSLFYKDKNEYTKEYNNRFNSYSTEKFDFKIGEHQAFLIYTREIVNLLEEIHKLDKKLLVLTNKLPKTALTQYKKKCLIDEIHLTNEIEGVYSTRKEISELIDIINNKDKKDKQRLYGLVQKYCMLTSRDYISLNTCEDIRKLYDELVLAEVSEEDEKNIPDGKIFRKEKTYVISKSMKEIHEGVSPEENIIDIMEKALKFLNNSSYNFLIRTAVFHYLFGYIHPFYDGNGRTSRFISSYLLSKELNILVSYSLSYTIKSNINEYYKAFKITNDNLNKGDLTPFVITFLGILCKVYNPLQESLEEKLDKLNFYISITEKITDKNPLYYDLVYYLFVNSLFGNEGICINELEKHLNCSKNTVINYLNKLKEKDYLRITKNGNKYLYDMDLEKTKSV